MSAETETAQAMVGAGAADYLPKTAPLPSLIASIRKARI